MARNRKRNRNRNRNRNRIIRTRTRTRTRTIITTMLRERYLKLERFTVNMDGANVDVIVTASYTVVRSWIENTLDDNRHRRRLIVGLGVQCTPSAAYNPPAETLQLCVGYRCLIVQLAHAEAVPLVLRRFLQNPSHTFVGFKNHHHHQRLRYTKFRLEMLRNPLDLRFYAKREDGGNLYRASIEEIVEICLGYQVEQRRTIGLSNWNIKYLNRDQVAYATVEAYCAFLIGSNLIRN